MKEVFRPKRLELAGRRVGRWTVIEKTPKPEGKKSNGQYWLCRCDCGTTAIHQAGKLNANRGVTGCKQCRGHGATISGCQTPEYQSWRGMKERCGNSKNANYPNYGGRGIKVCKEWLSSFTNFLSDMGSRPAGFSLDRINVNGDYEPDNCRWASAKTQANNKREQSLADEQVAAVYRAHKSGSKISDLAIITGMSRSYIAAICEETWCTANGFNAVVEAARLRDESIRMGLL